ncbi:hypothetical protein [Variovorax sp. 38R]|uniref:hypothetical protein n=1 Tax=Variovorax sp. 38R TaxID=2774875 RepID=UPI0017822150|nr:hypothetical protein [Variovorax sp. 38R]QOF76078.1 hypothetical protein IG196_16845 [Variovorax sp. 38R]
MDDEDSKIRRNLVAACMLILLAGWLRAPLDVLSEQLLKLKPVGPDFAWRVWIAAGAALVYFALRFRFSSENLDALHPLEVEYFTVEKRIVASYLARRMAKFVRVGAARPLDTGALSMFVEAQRRGIEQTQGGNGNAKLQRITVAQTGRAARQGGQAGERASLKFVEADLTIWFSSNGGLATNVVTLGFELPAWVVARIKLNTLAWMLMYSKASTQILLPWILSACAFLLVVYKVYRTW